MRLFSSNSIIRLIAEGVMPDIRAACPSVTGRISSNFCATSCESPGTPSYSHQRQYRAEAQGKEEQEDHLPSDSDGNEEMKTSEEKLVENFSKTDRKKSEEPIVKKTAKKRKIIKESVSQFLAKRKARELEAAKLLPASGMDLEKIKKLKELEKSIKKR